VFTGLVEEVVRVVRVQGKTDGMVLSVERPSTFADVRPADSLSVSGVCLTVLETLRGAPLAFDVSPETLRRTTLGGLKAGDRVNLERAMAANGRFGGHMVAGHVDATSRVMSVIQTGEFWTFTFELDAGVARYVVEKGSVALDGISLTVAALGERSFDVAVIPWTYDRTTLGERKAGGLVNLEVDLLGKYVERLLGAAAKGQDGREARDTRLLDLLSGR